MGHTDCNNMKLFLQNVITCPKDRCQTDDSSSLKLIAKTFKLLCEHGKNEFEEPPEDGLLYGPKFNMNFIRNLREKIDYDVLLRAVGSLKEAFPQVEEIVEVMPLPHSISELDWQEETFLRTIHKLLFLIEITTGKLICSNCGASWAIDNGIPNMLTPMNEDGTIVEEG